MKKQAKLSNPGDYEKLGRAMASVYEYGYVNKWRLFKLNFLKGIAAGLGSVVGATLLVGLILGLLSVINYIPLVRPIIEPLRETLSSEQR